MTKLAHSVQTTLGSTWAIGESGAAGPTLSPHYRPEIKAGYCPIAIVGPNNFVHTEIIETNSSDRAQNMVAFATAALDLLRGCIDGARLKAKA